MHTFVRVLGPEWVVPMKPLLTGEGFSFYGMNGKIPSLYFNIGSTDKMRWDEAQQKGRSLPVNHSPYLAPAPKETIRTGVVAMTAAVLDLLGKR